MKRISAWRDGIEIAAGVFGIAFGLFFVLPVVFWCMYWVIENWWTYWFPGMIPKGK